MKEHVCVVLNPVWCPSVLFVRVLTSFCPMVTPMASDQDQTGLGLSISRDNADIAIIRSNFCIY